MTLRQKLCDPFGGLRTETADQLEQIADEHAIQFAKWCVYYTYHESFDCWIKNDNLKAERFTSNELICKFKKEKDCE